MPELRLCTLPFPPRTTLYVWEDRGVSLDPVCRLQFADPRGPFYGRQKTDLLATLLKLHGLERPPVRIIPRSAIWESRDGSEWEFGFIDLEHAQLSAVYRALRQIFPEPAGEMEGAALPIVIGRPPKPEPEGFKDQLHRMMDGAETLPNDL